MSNEIGCGIQNLGNTCYANALLSVLCRIPLLREIFLVNKVSLLCRVQADSLCLQLIQLFTDIYSKEKSSVNPLLLLKNFTRIHKNFLFSRQQDVHEFFCLLYEELEKELNYKDPYFVSANYSLLDGVFTGILNKSIRCEKCKKVSVTREKFTHLPLILGKESDNTTSYVKHMFFTAAEYVYDTSNLHQSSVIGCLQEFFEYNSLSGETAFDCDKCNSFTLATMKTTIEDFPQILVLHAVRFKYSAYGAKKLYNKLNFSLHDLTMNAFATNLNTSATYELFAIICHMGRMKKGHYVSYVKAFQDEWYLFDDTNVKKCYDMRTIQLNSPYMFFYRKKFKELRVFDIYNVNSTNKEKPFLIPRLWTTLTYHRLFQPSIQNFLFSCPHEKLSTFVFENIDGIFYRVNKESWNELVLKYKGGPMLKLTDMCKTCEKHDRTKKIDTFLFTYLCKHGKNEIKVSVKDFKCVDIIYDMENDYLTDLKSSDSFYMPKIAYNFLIRTNYI